MKSIKTFIFIATMLAATICSAREVYFGARAAGDFSNLIAQAQTNPSQFAVQSDLFLSDDVHPELGRLRMTEVYTRDGSYWRCWQNDYIFSDPHLVDYGCERD